MAIDELETSLREKAHASSGLNAVIAFDLGPDGTLFLDGHTAPPTVGRDGAGADTTIVISAADFAALLAGSLNPMTAFGAGRLKVEGDTGPAMKLSALFG